MRGERLSLAMRLIVFICISLTSCLFPLSSASQTLTGSAPSHVAVGEQFRLTYTVNTQNATDFRAGDIPGELEVLIGPNRSMQSSYQMINGHTSSSSSITYTLHRLRHEERFLYHPSRTRCGGWQDHRL